MFPLECILLLGYQLLLPLFTATSLKYLLLVPMECLMSRWSTVCYPSGIPTAATAPGERTATSYGLRLPPLLLLLLGTFYNYRQSIYCPFDCYPSWESGVPTAVAVGVPTAAATGVSTAAGVPTAAAT